LIQYLTTVAVVVAPQPLTDLMAVPAAALVDAQDQAGQAVSALLGRDKTAAALSATHTEPVAVAAASQALARLILV
jgi:hypothetical protein